MGNRAVITASASKRSGIGIYLHWHGDIEQIVAILDAAKARGYRDPTDDQQYGMARLCGMLCELNGMRDDTGIGIGTLQELDTNNGDNGVYVIGPGWELKSRWGSGSKPLAADDVAKARASVAYATTRMALE